MSKPSTPAMSATEAAPAFPAGPPEPAGPWSDAAFRGLAAAFEAAPRQLGDAVRGLTAEQLDVPYRNWSSRQIVHHLADAHANGYVRCKLALTEKTPVIKPYDETAWTALESARHGDIEPPLRLFEGVQACWVQLLRTLGAADCARGVFHPEAGRIITVAELANTYAWHARHHTAQIVWLRNARGWGV